MAYPMRFVICHVAVQRPDAEVPSETNLFAESVMAQEIAHDVVKEAQSIGALSSIGDSATPSSIAPAVIGHPNAPIHSDTTNETSSFQVFHDSDDADRISIPDIAAPSRDFAKSPLGEKALLAEASGGSDTDTSKPDGLER